MPHCGSVRPYGFLRPMRLLALQCVTACALAFAFAPLSASALEGLDPVVLPKAPTPSADAGVAGDGANAVPALLADHIADSVHAPTIAETNTAALVAGLDVTLPSGGRYYWAGTYLCVDGFVVNNTATDLGPVSVYIEVQDEGHDPLVNEEMVAAIYRLKPGERAAFQGIFNLPAYAGSDLYVTTSNLAFQPTLYPSAVDLALVDRTVTDEDDGTRTYTCVFRNDSSLTVKAPLVGGWEIQNDYMEDAFWHYQPYASIPPGGTLTVDLYGFYPGIAPDLIITYCQALPVVPSIKQPVYRFFNTRNGSHFYTPSSQERDMVIAQLASQYRYEGIAYHTNPATNSQPLYRFFYPRGGSHFYTASPIEANMVRTKWPNIFIYEGTTYSVSPVQVANAVPVFRFINRRTSTHFYTASVAERDAVQSRLSSTYIYEGLAFWVAP
ncbi:MAG: hypothetical protein JXE06_09685 [Coriobacteriia bacterium]|nr:hypothetical protein [Coriobacteriia bacterium]